MAVLPIGPRAQRQRRSRVVVVEPRPPSGGARHVVDVHDEGQGKRFVGDEHRWRSKDPVADHVVRLGGQVRDPHVHRIRNRMLNHELQRVVTGCRRRIHGMELERAVPPAAACARASRCHIQRRAAGEVESSVFPLHHGNRPGGCAAADLLMTPPRFARNLFAVLLWELMWGFGNACTSSPIFVPFLSQLAGSKRLVGTVGLTMLLGIPALVVSLWLAHRLRRRRLVVALLWAAQVVGWVVLGLVLRMPAPPASAIVSVIYASQGVFAFLAGVSMAPTYQLLTSVFGERFGTAQGLQLLVRQVSGVVGGLWAASALGRDVFPKNFGLTFLVGGILLTSSNVALLFFVEPPRAADAAPRPPFLPEFGRTLREARPVASLLWVIACAAFLVSAEALFVVSALERLKLGDAYAGVFASVTLAASGIGGAIAGWVGDRVGHARTLVVSLVLQIAAFVMVLELLGMAQFYVALSLAGFASAAMQIGLAGLTTRLAPPHARGAWMAIMRWLTQLVSALATATAAFLADRVGYTLLFAVCIARVVGGLLAMRGMARGERRIA